jgi:hypothetical protein
MVAKRISADTWRDRIMAQQSSGQSIRSWCRANGCAEHAFYWWRVRLKMRPAGTRRRGPRPVNPIKFARVIASLPAEPIRLHLTAGRELLLPASMPVADLAALVRAVEGMA